MNFDQDQIEELKQVTPNLSVAQEGGYTFILIQGLKLPDGCEPAEIEALLCPCPKDGYESRLYFPQIIQGCPSRNWNGRIKILDKDWFAFSWRTPGNQSLLQMLMLHLRGLRQ